MNAQVDLRALSFDRSGSAPLVTRRRPIVVRYVLPVVIVCGFLGLLGWAARESLLPATPVTVASVIVTRAEVQRSGEPLFQAAGWIEPRPTPVYVSALTEGVVESLLVVNGQSVEKGDALARLIDVDAKLALREAEAARDLQQSQIDIADAELKAARSRLETPAHLEAALAEAESALAQTETNVAQLPFLIQSAEAREDYARRSVQARESAGIAVSGQQLREAQSEHAVAQSLLAELRQRGPRLEREAEALRKRAKALATQLELLVEERRRVENAQAELAAAGTRLAQAELAVEKAKLALERTVIVSPIRGRVLNLIASPGSRLMGLSPQSMPDASAVLTLYDPASLQVRADVRLEDVPLVQPGQSALVETASFAVPLRGTVLLPTSSANVQKNTLEVKIALDDPPESVRPEMLVAATFLAPELPANERNESADQERLLVPRRLVQNGESGSLVWVVGPNDRANRRTVRTGRAGTSELIEIIEGLTPTDKLIASGTEALREGERVTVVGEASDAGETVARS
jgi:multidrug efflux pump subunit AcrA (membrane-fusion protein)